MCVVCMCDGRVGGVACSMWYTRVRVAYVSYMICMSVAVYVLHVVQMNDCGVCVCSMWHRKVCGGV